MPASNPLVASLLEPDQGGELLRHYGDQPEVLEAIRKARRDNKRGCNWIAARLSTPEIRITKSNVETFLKNEGLL